MHRLFVIISVTCYSEHIEIKFPFKKKGLRRLSAVKFIGNVIGLVKSFSISAEQKLDYK